MVKAEILQRLLLVKYNSSLGTAFTIEKNKKQYVISAKHVFRELTSTDSIEYFTDHGWKKIRVSPIFCAENNVDIVALKPDKEITLKLPVELGSTGVILSQDAFFLGYPYDLHHKTTIYMSGSPVPIVKKAVVSAIDTNIPGAFLLDGHNNPGFSGGPVIIEDSKGKTQIIGVISGYYPDPFTGENSGIIQAYYIDKIIKAI